MGQFLYVFARSGNCITA